jgi:hypothetical protein
MTKYPYTTKPQDITALLQKIPELTVPVGKVDVDYLKSWGFSVSSGNHLLNILKNLGFINERNEATPIWQAYVEDEHRALVLASALQQAYGQLFESVFCPYLESDENLIDFFKREEPETTAKVMPQILETFRRLSDLADFQDLMCVDEPAGTTPPDQVETLPEVKINPNLQLNIQIHIDPATPEEKIEAIFKNMKKYLLENKQ